MKCNMIGCPREAEEKLTSLGTAASAHLCRICYEEEFSMCGDDQSEDTRDDNEYFDNHAV